MVDFDCEVCVTGLAVIDDGNRSPGELDACGLREECGPCMRLGYVYKKVLFLFFVTGILYGDSVCVAILRLCDELSV